MCVQAYPAECQTYLSLYAEWLYIVLLALQKRTLLHFVL